MDWVKIDNKVYAAGSVEPVGEIQEEPKLKQGSEICSWCGREHESVNRLSNQGLCLSCLRDAEDNHWMRWLAYNKNVFLVAREGLMDFYAEPEPPSCRMRSWEFNDWLNASNKAYNAMFNPPKFSERFTMLFLTANVILLIVSFFVGAASQDERVLLWTLFHLIWSGISWTYAYRKGYIN